MPLLHLARTQVGPSAPVAQTGASFEALQSAVTSLSQELAGLKAEREVVNDRIDGSEGEAQTKLTQQRDQLDGKITQTELQLESAKAAVAGAAEAVNVAKIVVGYAEIRAPVGGVVAERLAEPGDLAVPGRPLLTIQDPAHLRLEAAVRDRDAHRISMRHRCGRQRLPADEDAAVDLGSIDVEEQRAHGSPSVEAHLGGHHAAGGHIDLSGEVSRGPDGETVLASWVDHCEADSGLRSKSRRRGSRW